MSWYYGGIEERSEIKFLMLVVLRGVHLRDGSGHIGNKVPVLELCDCSFTRLHHSS